MDEALRKRIENRLKELAAALDISITSLEWGPSNFEVKSGPGIQPAGPTQYPLAVTVGMNRKVVKFTEDDLDDCSQGKQGNAAWQKIEHQLKEVLGEFAPKKKRIGF